MKVFFSWQTTKGKRQVVENYIREAISRLNNVQVAVSTPEPTNSYVALEDLAQYEFDSDTKGVPGSPPIFSTILAKIEKADVFVADMTPVEVDIEVENESGKTIEKRYFPNPNVMAEYGYALKTLSFNKIICVINESAVENYDVLKLPFDMRNQRGPMLVRTGKLSETSINSISHAIEIAAQFEPKEIELHSVNTETAPGIAFDIKKPLATRIFNEGGMPIYWTAEQYFYMRLWPEHAISKSSREIETAINASYRAFLPFAGHDINIRKPDGLFISLSFRKDESGSLSAMGYSFWGTDGEVNMAVLINGDSLDMSMVSHVIQQTNEMYRSLWDTPPITKLGFVLEEGSTFPFKQNERGRLPIVQNSHTFTKPRPVHSAAGSKALFLELLAEYEQEER
jgi:hypothetical protein